MEEGREMKFFKFDIFWKINMFKPALLVSLSTLVIVHLKGHATRTVLLIKLSACT